MGEFRNVDRDGAVLLLEKIIQALYGNKTELKGNVRTVSQEKTNKIVKLVPFDKDGNLKKNCKHCMLKLNIFGNSTKLYAYCGAILHWRIKWTSRSKRYRTAS